MEASHHPLVCQHVDLESETSGHVWERIHTAKRDCKLQRRYAVITMLLISVEIILLWKCPTVL